MPDTSPILSLPLIQAAQAQKHVTHNEAVRMLDVIVQLSVLTATATTPPASVNDGDRFIVASGATGDWAGKDHNIAWQEAGIWQFVTPNQGWRADVADVIDELRFDGSQWVSSTPTTNSVDLVGVNTTADTINRLAVASDASLLSNDGSSHRLKINKAASADTASLLFQSNWTGYAEFGLAGDNDFRIKTSADGIVWNEALMVTGGGDIGIGKSPAAKLDVDGIMRLTPVATAALPAANAVGQGGVAFVSDISGGAQLAYSDGTNWRTVRDGTII